MKCLFTFLIQATLGTSVLVLLAMTVSSLPVAVEMKWYDLERGEMQALSEQIKALGTLEDFNEDGVVSITFGKPSSNFLTDDGTYLFDAYRIIGPKEVTHVVLSPAFGDPQAPPPPFQIRPGSVISSKELVDSTTSERGEAHIIFPTNAKLVYKGSPVFVLKALGKVNLRVSDVKKLMNHRGLV